jgi:hypothetical protein
MTENLITADVAVLVPTLALPQRRFQLWRALESILSQQGVRVRPIVIVNGGSPDPGLVDELTNDSRLEVLRIPEGTLPAALRAGEAHARATYFTTLDDDDELLPGGLAARVDAFGRDGTIGAVVTNGIRRDADGDSLHRDDLAQVRADPMGSMLRGNWLLPGAWLVKGAALPAPLFEHIPRYLECTYLALRLATWVRIGFLDEPTVVWYTNSPAAMHHSLEFLEGQAEALLSLLELPLPGALHAEYRRRTGDAWHAAADFMLHHGRRREAWTHHLRSLRSPGGWRYLPFTRRFLYPNPGGQP